MHKLIIFNLCYWDCAYRLTISRTKGKFNIFSLFSHFYHAATLFFHCTTWPSFFFLSTENLNKNNDSKITKCNYRNYLILTCQRHLKGWQAGLHKVATSGNNYFSCKKGKAEKKLSLVLFQLGIIHNRMYMLKCIFKSAKLSIRTLYHLIHKLDAVNMVWLFKYLEYNKTQQSVIEMLQDVIIDCKFHPENGPIVNENVTFIF